MLYLDHSELFYIPASMKFTHLASETLEWLHMPPLGSEALCVIFWGAGSSAVLRL